MMRILLLGLGLATVGAASPSAQTPTAPVARPAAPAEPLGPPRAFQGYTQPDITQAYCKVVNTGQTSCILPAMTAGRYLIEASGTSTATGPGAIQDLAIVVGQTNCGVARRRPTDKAPWNSGSKTLKLNCDVKVITDRPLTVTAVYADAKATKSPAGPTLTLRRLPWDGVLSATAISPKQD